MPFAMARTCNLRRKRMPLPLARRSLLAAATSAVLCWLPPSTAFAGTANAGLSGASASNPIADMTWGYYTGSDDEIWPTYEAATGTAKQLLGKSRCDPRPTGSVGGRSPPRSSALSRDTSKTSTTGTRRCSRS
ncbi:MAG TPA: hypothetical protein VHU61_11825 [Solirubrobacteraceae bacterium]|nr:hypothetical protein [Solirubrobacteraceae bacterium]